MSVLEVRRQKGYLREPYIALSPYLATRIGSVGVLEIDRFAECAGLVNDNQWSCQCEIHRIGNKNLAGLVYRWQIADFGEITILPEILAPEDADNLLKCFDKIEKRLLTNGVEVPFEGDISQTTQRLNPTESATSRQFRLLYKVRSIFIGIMKDAELQIA